MRRHSSILMLYARSSLHRVGLLILILALLQGILFWGSMKRGWDYAVESAAHAEEGKREGLLQVRSTDPAAYMGSLDEIWANSLSAIPFCVAGVVLTVIVTATGWERKEKVSYTLKRLSVSEKAIFMWNGLYNTLCFFLFWAAQVFIILGLGLWYMKWVGEITGPQTLFLAFYRHKFFHDLLPLEDIMCWIRNVIVCLSLGFSSAGATFIQRRDGKMGLAVIPMMGVAAMAFLQEESMFGSHLLVMACSLFLLGSVIYVVFQEEE